MINFKELDQLKSDLDYVAVHFVHQLCEGIIFNLYIRNKMAFARIKIEIRKFFECLTVKQGRLLIVCGDFNTPKQPIMRFAPLKLSMPTF